MTQPDTSVGFDNLGIAPTLLEVLTKNQYTTPTPIQHQAIPVILAGKDVVGIAQTGTGKTLAFGLPMLQQLALTKKRGLILLPTRELALQVDEALQKLGRPLGLRTVVLIGGASMRQQIQALHNRPHILVATPGRLMDHIKQKNVNFSDVGMVVLDEADRMLDIGFAPQIEKILAMVPKDRQTLLFSATMPKEIAALAARHMRMPLRVEVAPAGTSATNVEQEVFFVDRDLKLQLLDKLLAEQTGTVLVFSRTKHGAKKITSSIRSMGHTAVEIHSNRTLAQRKHALQGFKTGLYRVLVATDIAARGIDVIGISLVINFDLPDNSEDYVHRIGRTGRAGHTGKAISFATGQQRSDIKAIERLIRKTLPILALPVLPPRRAAPLPSHTIHQPKGNGAYNYPPRRQGGFRGGRPQRRSGGGQFHRGPRQAA